MKPPAIILFLLILTPIAYSVGISQTPLEIIEPGETIEHRINVQNDHNRTAEIVLVATHPWTSFDGENTTTLTLPPNKIDNYAYLSIVVPEDAQRGTNHTIRYTVTSNDNTEGQVPMGVAINSRFTVQVAPEPQVTGSDGTQMPWAWIGIGIILLVLVFVLYTQSARLTRLVRRPAINLPGGKARTLHQAALLLSQSEVEWPSTRDKVASWVHELTGDAQLASRLKAAKDKDELTSILLHS